LEEKEAQEFLVKTGLKAKEIADRLNMGDRAVFKYMKSGKIPPYICKLIQLEFSEYNFDTGQKVFEPGEEYAGPSEIINKKNEEIEQLKNRCDKLEDEKEKLTVTIGHLNQMIELLQGNNGGKRTAS